MIPLLLFNSHTRQYLAFIVSGLITYIVHVELWPTPELN